MPRTYAVSQKKPASAYRDTITCLFYDRAIHPTTSTTLFVSLAPQPSHWKESFFPTVSSGTTLSLPHLVQQNLLVESISSCMSRISHHGSSQRKPRALHLNISLFRHHCRTSPRHPLHACRTSLCRCAFLCYVLATASPNTFRLILNFLASPFMTTIISPASTFLLTLKTPLSPFLKYSHWISLSA